MNENMCEACGKASTCVFCGHLVCNECLAKAEALPAFLKKGDGYAKNKKNIFFTEAIFAAGAMRLKIPREVVKGMAIKEGDKFKVTIEYIKPKEQPKQFAPTPPKTSYQMTEEEIVQAEYDEELRQQRGY